MTRIFCSFPGVLQLGQLQRMVSMASLLALSMKPQVLMTTTSLPRAVLLDGDARLEAQGHHLLGVDPVLVAAQGYKCIRSWFVFPLA